MAFNRDEYRASIAEAETQRSADSVRDLKRHARASLEAQAVTGDPHWDYYLSHLQAAIETTDAQIAHLTASLCDDTVVDHNQLMTLKLALAECKGMANAWKVARNLPKDLIENGEKATALLETLDTDNVTLLDSATSARL